MDTIVKPRPPVVQLAAELAPRGRGERMMRPHFSLRTFLLLVALLAGFCYHWFVLPTVTARRFIQAVADKDYVTADQLFRNPSDKFIMDSADKFWAFESNASLSPMTFNQLIRGRRNVRLQVDYFHLDQNVSLLSVIPATSFGLKSPVVSRIDSAVIIDRQSSPRMVR